MMLKNCIFHEPFITCDTLERLISGQKFYYKIYTCMFTALQVSICTKGLNEMNSKFIKVFLGFRKQ